MTGHNASIYLENSQTWKNFKKACYLQGKKPNTILRNFIEHYTNEILENEISIEKRIALAMIEAKKI